MSQLTTTPRFAVGEISAEIERTNQYTIAALARHKQEGLELAVRARWVALLVVAILLPFLNFQIEVLFTHFLLALIALNGWVLRRVGRVGRSRSELLFIFLDVVLITYALIGPNPLRVEILPTSIVFQFGVFSYVFIMLALGSLSYSWRTILALGHWFAGCWLIGSGLIWWFGTTFPELSVAVQMALAGNPFLVTAMDPNLVHFDRRIQEVVVLLICAYTLALSVRRFEGLVLGNAGLERERSNLSRYFSPTMVEELSNNDEPLKQIRTQNVAVLFVDIVGFTSLSANRDPRDVIAMLRQFHGLMENCVFSHGGTLDKFLGDGLMATFGTPVIGDKDATNALVCVQAMIAGMQGLNAHRLAEGEPELQASFGIHYGPVVMGDIGANRLEFAVIGNTVNVASRLEALTRPLAVQLVISDDVHQQIQNESGVQTPELTSLHCKEGQAIRGLDHDITVWTFT